MTIVSRLLFRFIFNILLDRLAERVRLGIIPDSREAAGKYVEVCELFGLPKQNIEHVASEIARRAGQFGDD